jgi:type IV pilus assembly protein PilM
MPAQLGIDIGGKSIKLVEVKQGKNQWELTTWGKMPTPARFASKNKKDLEKVSNALKDLIKQASISTKDVILGLPETEVFSQVIQTPVLSSQELATSIEFEAEQYIPLPLDQVQLEYMVVDTPEDDGGENYMKVLLIAAKKHSVDNLIEVAKRAGLNPEAMETELIALTRLSNNNSPKQNVLVIDLGHKSTDISVSVAGNMRFVRSLKTGGEALSRSLAQNLDLDFSQAEQYKATYGVDKTQFEGKVYEAIKPALNVITEEVKKSLVYFRQKNPDTKIDLALLSGGGSAMPGASSYFTSELNIETSLIEPFSTFIQNDMVQSLDNKQSFAVPVGLAIRD